MQIPTFLQVLGLPRYEGLNLGVTATRALERFSDLASGHQSLAIQPEDQRLDIIDECLDLVLLDPKEPAGFQFTGASLAEFWAAISKTALAPRVERWRKALLAQEINALRDGARDRIGRRAPNVWLDSWGIFLPSSRVPVIYRQPPDSLVRLFGLAQPGWRAGKRSPMLVELTRQVGKPGKDWPTSGPHWPGPDQSEIKVWTVFNEQRLQPRGLDTWYEEFQLCLPSLETSYFPDWFMVRNGFAHIRATFFVDDQDNSIMLIDDVFSEWLRDLELQRLGRPLAPSRLTMHRKPDDPLYDIDTQYTPQPVPDCPVADGWVDLVAEGILRIAMAQGVDRIAWMPAAIMPEIFPERPIAPMRRLFHRALPVKLCRLLRLVDLIDGDNPEKVHLEYPTYARTFRAVRECGDLMLVDQHDAAIHGPFETLDEWIDAYAQANEPVVERLPAFVLPEKDARLDLFGVADTRARRQSDSAWRFETARELTDDQAGGHGDRWSVFDEDVDRFVTRWLPVALEHGKVADFGLPSDELALERLLAVGEPRAMGLLHADRAEDVGQAGLLAVIAMDLEDASGERHNQFWSAYPFFAEGIQYMAQVVTINLYPNRLEARLDLSILGTLVMAFDPLFYRHRALYRRDEPLMFSLSALAYRMEPTGEKEFVIDDEEGIRAFRAREAWAKIHGAWTKDDEAAALAAWKPQSLADEEPIRFDLSRGSTLWPSETGPADDAAYQGEVKAVIPEIYRLFDVTVWRVDVVVARPDDEELILPIFVTEPSFPPDWRPSLGENVTGWAWIQAWAVRRPTLLDGYL